MKRGTEVSFTNPQSEPPCTEWRLGRGASRPLILVTVALLVFFTTLAPRPGHCFTSVNVPLGDWAYAALDKLQGFGLIQSDIQGSRPFSRIEVARLIDEALGRKRASTGGIPPLVEDLLQRLQKDYREELALVGRGTDILAKSFLKPVHEIQTGYVYVDGKPRQFVNLGKGDGNYPGSNSGIVATEGTPLLYNRDGINFGENSNYYLQFSSMLGYRDFFAGYVEPILVARQTEGEMGLVGNKNWGPWTYPLNGYTDATRLDLLKGYGKLSLGKAEIEAGRDSMWWGQGRHGSLLLTNNASPLDMIKLSNPEPITLPWVLSNLGLFKYSVFASRLQDYPDPPDPWLGGFRLDFKPHPLFEMGFGLAMQCGGKGVPGLSWSDILKILSFQSPKNANQLAALDLRMRIPFLRNAEFYMEYGGEDSGGLDFAHPNQIVFDDDAWLFGLYFPRLTSDGKADLRLEYTRNAHRVDETPGFWYGHSRYRGGYTNDSMIMGHHMGPDADDFFARMSYYVRSNINVGVEYDRMVRGITLNPVDEKVNQMGLDLTVDVLGNAVSVTTRYGFETVQNYDNQPGEDRNNHLLETAIKMRF